jgi:hypothetical protein
MNESHKSNLLSEPSKKPYNAPHLIEYGPVEKLTHGGSGTGVDGTMVTMACL